MQLTTPKISGNWYQDNDCLSILAAGSQTLFPVSSFPALAEDSITCTTGIKTSEIVYSVINLDEQLKDKKNRTELGVR